MNRRRFITKNQLNIRSFVFVTLMIAVIGVFFMVMGNSATFATLLESSHTEQITIAANAIVSGGTDTVEKLERHNSTRINDRISVGLYGSDTILDSLASQMDIMSQSYAFISDLDNMTDTELLIVSAETLTSEELSSITAYVQDGGNVWFCSTMSEDTYADPDARTLLGIRKSGSLTHYEGKRFSTEIIPFNTISDIEDSVDAVDITLRRDVKIYAAGLPDNYLDYENEDLPPLFWRYVPDDGSGSVYVSNGSCFEDQSTYAILPEILKELNGDYVYSIINAYVFSVQNYPLAENTENDKWARLYSRDLFGIERDMLYTLYMRFPTAYDSVTTYFTPDYDKVTDPDNDDMQVFREGISSSGGSLLTMDDSGLHFRSADDAAKIEDWTSGFKFYDQEDNSLSLPIDYEYRIEDSKLNLFSIAGSAYGLGYYSLSTDTTNFLYDESEYDSWEEYCSNLETALGISKRDYSWLDRVSFDEALCRLYAILTDDLDIEYGEDSITISTEREDGSFFLKTGHTNPQISDPAQNTLTKINDSTYIVTVRNKHAVITWED